MRDLASIQRILNIADIKNADRIELTTVKGFHSVVEKGKYKKNDLCIYVEDDSLLPSDNPEFDFLKENGKMKRIRTVKRKGKMSEGIIFPLSILSAYGQFDYIEDQLVLTTNKTNTELFGHHLSYISIKEDVDVTNIIGIEKWEPYVPLTMSGLVRGIRPDWVAKTDETRIQVLQEIIDKYQDTVFYVTEKIDGTSLSVGIHNGDFVVSSREQSKKYEETNKTDIYVEAAFRLDLKEKLELYKGKHNQDLVLQGELIGPSIQQNKYSLSKTDVYFFNAYDPSTRSFLSFRTLQNILKELELKMVPIVYEEFILKTKDIDELLLIADGQSVLNPKIYREGFVFRPHIEIIEEHDKLEHNRLSFKIVSKKFKTSFEDA